jgi:hypothetical protein
MTVTNAVGYATLTSLPQAVMQLVWLISILLDRLILAVVGVQMGVAHIIHLIIIILLLVLLQEVYQVYFMYLLKTSGGLPTKNVWVNPV